MDNDFEIVWSHSRLDKIIANPKEYYLSYKQGMSPKEKKPSLFLGSGVHLGLENNDPNLNAYFMEKYGVPVDEVTLEGWVKDSTQVMAESMVKAFLRRKQEFLDDILEYEGEKLEVIKEYHELELICEFPSHKFKDLKHKFKGIIDLLILTNKGWILNDYKTSSSDPEWTNYKSQMFDYQLLLMKNFPDVPIIKTNIINLKKIGIKLKKTETELEFQQRIADEYEKNLDLIKWHTYLPEEFDEEEIENYTENLIDMLDLARTIEDEHLYYLNHAATTNIYGKSDFWDVFYHTPDAYALYNIRDTIYDEQKNETVSLRDCVPIDMLTVEKGEKVLNKYWMFKKELENNYDDPSMIDKNTFFNYLRTQFIVDDYLLNEYWKTYQKEFGMLEKNE